MNVIVALAVIDAQLRAIRHINVNYYNDYSLKS